MPVVNLPVALDYHSILNLLLQQIRWFKNESVIKLIMKVFFLKI